MTIWCWFLVRRLRCSLLSFSFRAFLLIWFVSLLVGALCVEVDFGDLEAFLQCSFFGEVGFIDFETRSCSFYWVPSLMRSILMTLRYNLFFIQCTPFGGVDLLTLRHEFISCSALHLMGSVSLTLRYEFISCSALTSVGSISLTLRHQFNFCSGSLSDI